ncbi:MAG TPA: dTMP kinase [bacterium]|nr:dTMP kinase [bacterium]
MFVTFEGIDGSGKTTQIEMFDDWLHTQNITHTRIKEPNERTPIGTFIRKFLHERSLEWEFPTTSQLYLFLAERYYDSEFVIKPAIERGCTVICDRYHHSTLAYQCGVHGVDLNTYWFDNLPGEGIIRPDIVFLFDLDPQIAATRMDDRDRSKFDDFEQEKHEKIRQTFLNLSGRDDRVVILDATLPSEEIHVKVIKVFESHDLNKGAKG